jgi:hypothetical protein
VINSNKGNDINDAKIRENIHHTDEYIQKIAKSFE